MYRRNIAEAIDYDKHNGHKHNSINEAWNDAPSRHPIDSMTPVLGINPPAGVEVEGTNPFPDALLYGKKMEYDPVAEGWSFVLDNEHQYKLYDYISSKYSSGGWHVVESEPKPVIRINVDGTEFVLEGDPNERILRSSNHEVAIQASIENDLYIVTVKSPSYFNDGERHTIAVFFDNPNNYSLDQQEI